MINCLNEDFNELKNELSKLRPGDIFAFGDYHGEIIWRVLAKDRDQLLAISDEVIDCKPFDKNKSNNWRTSTLRYWLNTDFYNKAFNSEESSLIFNSGNDRVSLLTYREALSDLSKSERVCKLTPYAKNYCGYNIRGGSCAWWLSSPGITEGYTMYVGEDGNINTHGNSSSDQFIGVRPVIILDLI